MKKNYIIILLAALIMVMISACGNNTPADGTELIISTTQPLEEPINPNETNINPEEAGDNSAVYEAIIGYYQNYTLSGTSENARELLVNAVSNEINLIDDQLLYELDNSIIESNPGRMGYALKDVNADGSAELFILSDEYDIHSVYTVRQGSPVLAGGYWSRNTVQMDANGMFYSSSSGGAADSNSASCKLNPESGEFDLIEMVGIEDYDYEKGESLPEPRYYHIKNGEKTIISGEEANNAWENFPGYSTPSLTANAGLEFIHFNGLTEQEQVNSTRTDNSLEVSDEDYRVIVNGEDITDSIEIITVDGVLYAGAEAFTESITSSGSRIYTYNYEEYFGEPLEKDTIYIASWHTDVILFELRINFNTAVRNSGGSDGISEEVSITAPPVIENGNVYLPVEAFLELTGHDFNIQ